MKFGIFCSSIHEKKDLIRGNFAMKSSKTLRSIPLLDLQHNITKGQLISKCSHEMIVSSKIPGSYKKIQGRNPEKKIVGFFGRSFDTTRTF